MSVTADGFAKLAIDGDDESAVELWEQLGQLHAAAAQVARRLRALYARLLEVVDQQLRIVKRRGHAAAEANSRRPRACRSRRACPAHGACRCPDLNPFHGIVENRLMEPTGSPCRT